MPKFDHHLHTRQYSPDSVIDPRELVRHARAIGLDGLVITEHDIQWPADELADLAAEAGGLVVLSGVEVSAREGHFLVYGLPDTSEVGPGIGVAELLKVVRRRGAAIVAAHPFRWDQPFESILAEHGPAFDALELVSKNVTPQTRRQTERALAFHPMGTTGSSDGHELETIGCYFSAFPGPIRTIADFVAALKSRSGRPGHDPDAEWLASGPVES